MSELHQLSATEQMTELRGGHVSSRELVQHYLSRVEADNGRLGAFTHVFAEQALEAADAADRQPALSALHGLPVPLKDLHPSAGLPTTMGSAALRNWVAPQDGAVIARLRHAGAIFFAKTNAVEFGPACYTETRVGGNAETPYGQGYSASGSSGGAAAAVAARLAPIAHASDGLGSIRTPAANCGLVGFKPSRGRHPSPAQAWLSIGVEGPVARSVADAALFLDAMGAAEAHELWRGPTWGDGAYRATLTAATGRLRIARLDNPGIGGPIHPECSAALDSATKALTDLGHEVVELPLPEALSISTLLSPLLTIMSVSIAGTVQTLVPAAQQELLMPFTRWLVEQSKSCTGLQFAQAQARLAIAASQWLQMQSAYDMVLTPTTTAPPQPTGAFRLDEGHQSLETMLRWSAFTPWANLTGAPAVSLPVHVSKCSLPIGVQLIGKLHNDELLIALSAQLETVYRWDLRAPPSTAMVIDQVG